MKKYTINSVNFSTQAHQLYDDSIKALFKREYKDAEKLISKRESLHPLENELNHVNVKQKIGSQHCFSTAFDF